MHLYRITYRVRPAVIHPIYYEWGFGYLSIWIFDKTEDAMIDRAEKIVEQLPYEIFGTKRHITKCAADKPVKNEEGHYQLARHCGISVQLHPVIVGIEEADFIDAPWPGE
jgi:hypothetical protein